MSYGAQADRLLKAFGRGPGHHAYLFAKGEMGEMEEAARRAAALLQGEQGPVNPDLHIVFPEQGGSIGIDRVRELVSAMSMGAWSAPWKVGIILEAEKMNREAQAALLKFLEEPRGDAVLFLLSSRPSRILETILSRVLRVSFAEPQASLDPSWWENNSKEVAKLRALRTAPLAERFAWAEELAKSDNAGLGAAEAWVGYFRALLLGELRRGSRHVLRLLGLLKLAEEIAQDLRNTTASPRLSIERLLLVI